MGNTYLCVDQYLDNIDQSGIVLEIGSYRHEGSTEFFARIANIKNMEFHSVDIDVAYAQRRVNDQSIVWHQAAGSQWCKTVLPNLNKKISLLYLDNFDYEWDIYEHNDWILQQKQQYRDSFDMEMNNNNCQIEHATQMLLCLPYMSPQSVIVFDDTYQYNDCWIGKNGPAVVWLQAMGWQLKLYKDYGVILSNH